MCQEDLPGYKPLQSENEMLASATEAIDYCNLYALGFRDSFIASLANANLLKVRKTTQREQENNGGARYFTYLIADDGISRNVLHVDRSGLIFREILAGSDPQALFVFKCDNHTIKNVLIFNSMIELLAYLQIAILIGNWPWQTIAIASVDGTFQQRGTDSSETPFQTERLIALLHSLSLISPLKIFFRINEDTNPSLKDIVQRHIPSASLSKLAPSALANTIDGLNSNDKLMLRNSQSYPEVMMYLIQKIEQKKNEDRRSEQAEFKTLFDNSINEM